MPIILFISYVVIVPLAASEIRYQSELRGRELLGDIGSRFMLLFPITWLGPMVHNTFGLGLLGTMIITVAICLSTAFLTILFLAIRIHGTNGFKEVLKTGGFSYERHKLRGRHHR